MVAFNFQGRFVALVESGQKRQTIRAKGRAKVGDRVQLYAGLRSHECRKLIDPDPIVERVTYCAIRRAGITLGNVEDFPRDRDEFAQADGFRDYIDMLDWFEQTYGPGEFVGVLTRWRFDAASDCRGCT